MSDKDLKSRECKKADDGTRRRRTGQKLGFYLWNPKSTAHMCPLGPCSGSFHGTSSFGTEEALRMYSQDAGATQPAPFGYF